MEFDWATFGVDLHVDPDSGAGRRAGLERALRDAVRSGRLTPPSRLPSTRALAAQLGVARGTVAAAYDQLIAEGYLRARVGSGTTVAGPPPTGTGPASVPAAHRVPRHDLRPGNPDVTTFPTAAWLRATRRALAAAPASAHGYGDPAGCVELRLALAEYLGRTRGVLTTPERIVVTSGYVQALALLTEVLGLTEVPGDGPAVVAMEDPGLGFHREVVRRRGVEVVALPVDDRGARTELLSTSDFVGVRAVVLTPAHQYPTGVTLHPVRRRAAVDWAAAGPGTGSGVGSRTGRPAGAAGRSVPPAGGARLVIEDDYDGEFRYDRQPVGALQGMAPEQVAYLGTAAKTLGPALRLGWLVLPEWLVGPVLEVKRHTDLHTGTIPQLTLADLIGTHVYDRHVRSCRLRYRRRRDLLVQRLAGESAELAGGGAGQLVGGIAAGLHATVMLPDDGPDEATVLRRAARLDLAVGSLGEHWHSAGGHRQGLIIGYGTPTGSGYPAALDALVSALG